MSKPFAVFDIDGTLIRWQMLHEAIDFLGETGHLAAEDHAMIKQAKRAWEHRQSEGSYREYEIKLITVIEASLTGIAPEAFYEAVNASYEMHKDKVYRYTRSLLTELREKGYMLLAISGSPHELVDLIAAHYGFDDFVGSEYVQTDGHFTGEVRVAALKKAEILTELVAKHKLSFDNSIAVGDSESDIPMLEMVEQPIAFNPTIKFFQHAQEKGWKVVVERKNMVFELEQRSGHYELVKTNA